MFMTLKVNFHHLSFKYVGALLLQIFLTSISNIFVFIEFFNL